MYRLICANLNSRVLGRDSAFNLCHTLLKKAIIFHKRPKVQHSLSLTVSFVLLPSYFLTASDLTTLFFLVLLKFQFLMELSKS